MKPTFIQPEESEEFYTEERCHILEIYNKSTDSSRSLARARVEPGMTTAWHRLNGVTESYFILQGEGELQIGEDWSQVVKQHDYALIPAGEAQRIKNTGDKDLIFLCQCTPAFSDDCYEGLE